MQQYPEQTKPTRQRAGRSGAEHHRDAREPAGSSHRLIRLEHTGRGSCTPYATPPAVGCEVIFGGQSCAQPNAENPPTTTPFAHHSRISGARSLLFLIVGIPISPFSVGFTDNSQVCQRSSTRLTQLFRFAKHEELHCPLYPPLWPVLRLDPGRPSCRRDPVRGQPYARHGRANCF